MLGKEYAVVKILPVEGATIQKNVGYGGKGYKSTVIFELEDGRKFPKQAHTTLQRDMKAKLSKLPQQDVKGLKVRLDENESRIESSCIELFSSNAVFI